MKSFSRSLILFFLCLWLRSLRIKWHGETFPLQGIFLLWHEHLPICIRAFDHKNIAVLISQSKDGDWATELCQKLGYSVHRGSNSRGAISGMKSLARDAQKLGFAGMALDGPRGPYHIPQPGTLWLSQKLALPVYPIAVRAQFTKRLKSWDKGLIPLPFATIHIHLGQGFFPQTVEDLKTTLLRNQEAVNQLA